MIEFNIEAVRVVWNLEWQLKLFERILTATAIETILSAIAEFFITRIAQQPEVKRRHLRYPADRGLHT